MTKPQAQATLDQWESIAEVSPIHSSAIAAIRLAEMGADPEQVVEKAIQEMEEE